MNRARRDELVAMLNRCHIDDLRRFRRWGVEEFSKAKVEYLSDASAVIQRRIEVFGRVRDYCNDILDRWDKKPEGMTVADVVKLHPKLRMKISGLALRLGNGAEIAVSPVTLEPAIQPDQLAG